MIENMNKVYIAIIITIILSSGIGDAEDDIWQKVFSDSLGYNKVIAISEFKGDIYTGVGTYDRAKILGMVDPGCQNWVDMTPPWLEGGS